MVQVDLRDYLIISKRCTLVLPITICSADFFLSHISLYIKYLSLFMICPKAFRLLAC
jgi:hypothetical protein